MSPVFASRRRAEEFQASLERPLSTDDSSRDADARALVDQLRGVACVEPDPEFVTGLRGRLMAEADTALAAAPAALTLSKPRIPARAPQRERRIAAAVGTLALVGATASMAVAAQGALPGETLYPIKRALEDAQAGVQGDDDSKGTTILANASGRLAEIDELSRDQQARDAEVISSTLDTFSDQAAEASDLLIEAFDSTGRPELIDDVRVFAAQSMSSLRDLEQVVPRESRASLIQASQVLREIDQIAQQACPSCSAAFLEDLPLLSASSYDDLLGTFAEVVPAPASPQEPTTTPTQKPGKEPGKAEAPTTGDDSETGGLPQLPVTTDPPQPLPTPGGKGEQGEKGGKNTPDPKPKKNPITELAEELLEGEPITGSGGGVNELLEGTLGNLTDPLFP